MPKKQPQIPGTREVRPNREQRRHPERFDRPENEPIARDERPPQDQTEGGAGGRKKKTAENWNQ